MNTISVRDFMVENDFCQINRSVAENNNGYKFVTMIDSLNQAENIYLSKSLSEAVAVGTAVNKEFLRDKLIAEVKNSDGEIRFKLAAKGESLRVDFADLFD